MMCRGFCWPGRALLEAYNECSPFLFEKCSPCTLSCAQSIGFENLEKSMAQNEVGIEKGDGVQEEGIALQRKR